MAVDACQSLQSQPLIVHRRMNEATDRMFMRIAETAAFA